MYINPIDGARGGDGVYTPAYQPTLGEGNSSVHLALEMGSARASPEAALQRQ